MISQRPHEKTRPNEKTPEAPRKNAEAAKAASALSQETLGVSRSWRTGLYRSPTQTDLLMVWGPVSLIPALARRISSVATSSGEADGF